MKLEGSCACGAVHFVLQSKHPAPYQRCYCSICRKTSGGGGYCINTSGDASTLQVTGEEHVRIHRATLRRSGKLLQSEHERHFCGECGSHLWAFNPRWPELVHPVAGALDTTLTPPAERVHMMVGSKASWVVCEGEAKDRQFEAYPEEAIADFHDKRGWTVD